MGATLIMVVSIAIVLGLVLVLLAELYCSLLLRRRRQRSQASTSNIPNSSASATTNDGSPQHDQDISGTPSLSTFYAPGVLHAPRNFLFPTVHGNNSNEDLEKQHSQFSSPHPLQQQVFSLRSSPSFAPPKLVHQVPLHCSSNTYNDEVCGGSNTESYIYICNPIYDNQTSRPSRVDTPFETPDSSPSRLDTNGSSGEDDNDNDNAQSNISSPSSHPRTPPLTPMKKLPAEACSVSLRDAGSLATSGSDSNNEGISSSSTSESPCTSPSW
ncbi:hypothetical protein ACH5RR_004221 [Cinchona calisaya]|uniref:Uncharacterized protein n=1 Tax=Cinchona calisaya TaxID=153742 RepID=A0ABD3AXA6_9GENT